MFSMIIKRLVKYWVSIKIIDDSDKDIYEYGLELLLFSMLNIAVIMVTAMFTNRIVESITLIALVIPLQSFGGGYHAKTHLKCFLIMYIGWWLIMNLTAHITFSAILLISSIFLIIIFILAPVSNKNVPMSRTQYLKMKKLVRIVAIIAVIITIMISLPTIGYRNIGSTLASGMGVIAISMFVAHFKNVAEKFII